MSAVKIESITMFAIICSISKMMGQKYTTATIDKKYWPKIYTINTLSLPLPQLPSHLRPDDDDPFPHSHKPIHMVND